MSTCRECGQEIEWQKTNAGKNMPVDPGYIEYDEAEEGDTIITSGGNVLKVSRQNNFPTITGRVCHFGTCRKNLQQGKRF